MTSLDHLNRLLPSLSDEDKANTCEEILTSLPADFHDQLLKKRLEVLAAEKTQADKRIKAVLAAGTTATDDNLRMAYKEYSDEMRHFSTVRSALTTFLVTVTLAAFSAYFNKSQKPSISGGRRFNICRGGDCCLSRVLAPDIKSVSAPETNLEAFRTAKNRHRFG